MPDKDREKAGNDLMKRLNNFLIENEKKGKLNTRDSAILTTNKTPQKTEEEEDEED